MAATRGRELYAKKQYNEAIVAFTEAIEGADAEDVEALARLHSNRAACHQHVKRYEAAVEDAEATTSLKPTWAKGWSRLGAAKRAQGKYLEAAAAFDKASELESSTEAISSYANEAKAARALSERASQYYANAFSSSTSRAVAPDAFESTGPVGRALSTVSFGLRVLTLLNLVFYVISFDRQTVATRYRTMLFALFGAWVVNVIKKHGVPKFSKVYLQRVVSDGRFHRGLGTFVLFASNASFLPIVPLIYTEAAFFASDLVERVRASSSSLALKLLAFCESLTLLDGDTGEPSPKVFRNAATIEVGAGIATLVELLTPKRNFVFALLYGQYLQMRYILEAAASNNNGGPLHATFSALDAKISSILASPNVPSVANRGYAMLKGFAARQVALPEPGAPRPSPKCSIM